MKIGLKYVKDLVVGDVYVVRKETNTQHSSNIRIKQISKIFPVIIKHDNKIISAVLNKKIPPTELKIYHINDELYLNETELLEIVYD